MFPYEDPDDEIVTRVRWGMVWSFVLVILAIIAVIAWGWVRFHR